MPTLTACTVASVNRVSIWSVTKDAGTPCTPVTPRVDWAVNAVTTLIPKTPWAEKDFRSAWMPAPPLGSLPAMDTALKALMIWRSFASAN